MIYRLTLIVALLSVSLDTAAQDWAKIYYRYLSEDELGSLFGVREEFVDDDIFGVFKAPDGYDCIYEKQVAVKSAEIQLDLSDGMIAIMEVYAFSVSGVRNKHETFTGLITEVEDENGVIEIYWSSSTNCRTCQHTRWGKRKDDSDYGGGRRAEVTERFRVTASGLRPNGIVKNANDVFWFNRAFSTTKNRQFTDCSQASSLPGSVNAGGQYMVGDQSGDGKIWAITQDGSGTTRVHWYSLNYIRDYVKPIMAAKPGWEVMTRSQLQQFSEHMKSIGSPLYLTVADASDAGFNLMFGPWGRNKCHSSSSNKAVVLFKTEVIPGKNGGSKNSNKKKRRG